MKRMVFLTIVTSAVCFSDWAQSAQIEGPWCMHQSFGRAGVFSKCDLPSYEACRAEMRSMGASYCTENPYYWWNARQQPQPKAKRRVHNHR